MSRTKKQGLVMLALYVVALSLAISGSERLAVSAAVAASIGTAAVLLRRQHVLEFSVSTAPRDVLIKALIFSAVALAVFVCSLIFRPLQQRSIPFAAAMGCGFGLVVARVAWADLTRDRRR